MSLTRINGWLSEAILSARREIDQHPAYYAALARNMGLHLAAESIERRNALNPGADNAR